MRRRGRLARVLAMLLTLFACQDAPVDLQTLEDSPTAIARASRLMIARTTDDHSIGRALPLAQWKMPKVLQEISGLGLTADGRLLVHGDEIGQVWEIDYRRGILVKEFSLGKGALKSDFEAIAIVGDSIYLMSSKGKLYRFHEGKKDSNVAYEAIDTGLDRECEFEGMAYDREINSLLLACKEMHAKKDRDNVVIFRWRLDGDKDSRLSRITIPLEKVVGGNGWKEMHPSDITVDPTTGNYVLVASIEKAIFSVTPAGDVLWSRPLPPGHHQAEGVAITADSMLLISDEGGKAPAILTLYRWP